MKCALHIWATVLSLAMLTPSAHAADPFTDAQMSQLETRFAEFDAAVRANDMVAIGDILPPRILETVADQAGITRQMLLAEMAKVTELAMQNVTLDDFGFDISQARDAESLTGRPYLLIPTYTTITLNDGALVETRSQTLAFLESGIWHLSRIGEPQEVQDLVLAYPEFEGARVPGVETRFLGKRSND